MACHEVDVPKSANAASGPKMQTGPAPLIRAPATHSGSTRGALFATALRQHIHDVIDGKSYFDRYSPDASWMRVLFAIEAIQSYLREENASEAASLVKDLRGVLLELDVSPLCNRKIRSFLVENIHYLETDSAPDPLEGITGENEELSGSVQRIPTMVSKETLQYYKWLARTLEHEGDIVDLGSWMGSSAACLAEGLSENRYRKHRKIHAYDSFTWRDWMRTYTEDPELLAANIGEGASFLDYFCHFTAAFRHLIDVHQSVLRTATEQAALPTLEWSGGPIAVLVMDLAHDRALNEAMWRVFSPSFQDGTTIVIFNQYGNLPAAEVREFCREKSGELVPLHKPRSSAKAFRYKN
jgi:Methyltransferase domain